ncbi:MAG TPA: type II toxin-antitoxin system death-on-curing family toxin [Candidatus Competibacteraceae bacterium]|nr:type II toxin-antitoxin system death-on-curing family toxin [Candidatus Competibacteraceae bacterium]HRZ06747.1 type II toxin-antitoxin system death-on-curing family toxin [Candidatus Competibacteraceae bacterium]
MIHWVDEAVVLALHEEHLAEHGGALGLRERGLLQSALTRPLHLATYESPDFAALAAAYAYGITRNHPFLDGNKRTAFTVMELFLNLNGLDLTADDSSCVAIMLELAQGTLPENRLINWLREWTQALAGDEVGGLDRAT